MSDVFSVDKLPALIPPNCIVVKAVIWEVLNCASCALVKLDMTEEARPETAPRDSA